MSRDTKILGAAAIVQVVVAVAKSGASSTDDMLAAAKAEAIPVAVNIAGLWILFHLIK